MVITDSNGKQVVKFATNRVGNHYISGEWRTADSYPETILQVLSKLGSRVR
ncbi:hypothetical protein EfmAA290_24010 [Enterococcus faecium]|nr:hypothetical protein EfmAA290_24010 [Enterococcus faecium]